MAGRRRKKKPVGKKPVVPVKLRKRGIKRLKPIHPDVKVSRGAGVSPWAADYDRYWKDRCIDESEKFVKEATKPENVDKYEKNIGSFYGIKIASEVKKRYREEIGKSGDDYERGTERAHFEWDQRYKWYKRTGEGLREAAKRRKELRIAAEKLRKEKKITAPLKRKKKKT